ncbi:MAG: four helix bundle protein [Bacteroidetes bacterium]|nr:four helix bundle protein [Bacteroidota bacterium]
MNKDLKERTKQFSLAILNTAEQLPLSISGKVVANQLIRSGTSVGANYRAVCRSRSNKEFIAKMNIVLEEADEVCFWLELINEKKWIPSEIIDINLKEANELTAIFVSSLKTINAKLKNNSKL